MGVLAGFDHVEADPELRALVHEQLVAERRYYAVLMRGLVDVIRCVGAILVDGPAASEATGIFQ